MAALLNEANGSNGGTVTPALYAAAAADPTAFHSAPSLGTDFAHAGLGSPNLNRLFLAMHNGTPGIGSGLKSNVYAAAYPNVFDLRDGIPADGTTQAAVIVQIRDAGGNVVPGKTVTLAGSGGHHATISALRPTTTLDNGAAVFLVKDSTAERVTFAAFNVTDNVAITQTAAVDFLGPPAVAANIVALPTTVAADGVATSTITVTLQNAQAQGAAGKVVNLSQGTGHSLVTGPTPALTNASGQTTFTVRNNSAETVTYTAIDVTDGNLPVPGSAQVTFGGAPAEACVVGAGVAASGWAVSTFASGFPYGQNGGFNCIGPIGIAFGPDGSLYVSNEANTSLNTTGYPTAEVLYKFGPSGGIASQATMLPTYWGAIWCPVGLSWSKDGDHLYLARQGCGYSGFGDLFEINPTTGASIRQVADAQLGDLTGCLTGLATDPISGDLFGSRPCLGAGAPDIVRISGPLAVNPPVTVYASPGYTDGITFAPDGTLYAAVANGALNTDIVKLNGTNSGTPGSYTTIASITTASGIADGVAFASNPLNPAGFLVVNRNDGIMTLLDLSQNPATQTNIVTGASRGDFVAVGPDGCLYATMTDRILKVTKDDGTCPFVATSAFPSITLAPATVQVNPAQGTTKTFTARLNNTPSSPLDTPVFFTVSGANARVQMVRTNAQGEASFAFTGVFTGDDIVTASATINTKTLASNVTKLTWGAGRHTTFTTLNGSAVSGELNGQSALSASLTDISTVPSAPVSGASLHFTVNGQACDGVTNGQGRASCNVTLPGPAGSYTLNVSYAGSVNFLPSSDSRSFTTRAAPGTTCPAPSPIGLIAGANGTMWGGSVLSAAGQPSQFDAQLPGSVSAVFEWANAQQQFKFWFRGFPANFNTLSSINGGGFYFFQANQVGSLTVPNPGTFSLAGPGTASPVTTSAGATSALWQGTSWPLTGGPHPIDTLPSQVTAVFEWSDPGQQFRFWFRGFPANFQTLTEGLHFCGHYFFQDSAGGHTITMN
jgi:hypothetical protein